MDLGAPRKPSSKLGKFSLKQVAFLSVAGLVLIAGIVLRAGHYLGEPAGEEKGPAAVESSAPKSATPEAVTPEATTSPEAATAPGAETTGEPAPQTPPAKPDAATAPSEPVVPPGDAAQQAEPEGDTVEQTGEPLPDAGTILVARQPVELLASPSADATVMFGFPAGRPFRVIGQEGGFAHIRDMRSGATGWIDQAALAPPPPRAPAVSAPSQAKPAGGRKSSTASSDPKPKATKKKETSVADDSATATQPEKRPGLFGQGGLFGGIFSGGN